MKKELFSFEELPILEALSIQGGNQAIPDDTNVICPIAQKECPTNTKCPPPNVECVLLTPLACANPNDTIGCGE